VIKGSLANDMIVPANLIDVTTNDGIVTLSGNVNSLLERERALAIAENIIGVISVVDKIELRSIKRSDDEIRQDVSAALNSLRPSLVGRVEIFVKGGILELRGQAVSWGQKQLLLNAAKSIQGVRDVNNIIEVIHDPSRTDMEIRSEVEKLLELNVYVNDERLDVKVENGVVKLSGEVGNDSGKVHAYRDAWSGSPRSVDAAGLRVNPQPGDETKKNILNSETDSQIEKYILEGFIHNPRMHGFKINVSSNQGTVVLSGIVDNPAARMAAEEIARSVKGVLTVYNHIEVRRK
jgi:osmotically-inducible protein OsmY